MKSRRSPTASSTHAPTVSPIISSRSACSPTHASVCVSSARSRWSWACSPCSRPAALTCRSIRRIRPSGSRSCSMDCAPDVVLTHVAARATLDTATTGLEHRPATLDLVADAEPLGCAARHRPRPADARPHAAPSRLRHLHLRLHRHPQGRHGRAPQRRQRLDLAYTHALRVRRQRRRAARYAPSPSTPRCRSSVGALLTGAALLIVPGTDALIRDLDRLVSRDRRHGHSTCMPRLSCLSSKRTLGSDSCPSADAS